MSDAEHRVEVFLSHLSHLVPSEILNSGCISKFGALRRALSGR